MPVTDRLQQPNYKEIVRTARSFSLPTEDLLSSVSVFFVMLLALGILLVYGCLIRSPLLIATACGAAAVSYVSFRLIRNAEWVHVSASGIAGYGTNSQRTCSSWTDIVSMDTARFKGARGSGIDGVKATTANGKTEVFIPDGIMRSIDFQTALRDLLPEHHIVVRALPPLIRQR